MPGLSLNAEGFNAWRGAKTVTIAAAELGISGSSLSRVINGKSEPGPQFIAACLTTIPTNFDRLFDVSA